MSRILAERLPKIVAISGASGAGKTTIVKRLASHFSASSLFFDDFVEKTTYPSDMQQWYNLGADVSQIKTPQFTDALLDLKQTTSNHYIFIEEPFGYLRETMKDHIDAVVLLDTPLEICLARIISRHCKHGTEEDINNIDMFLIKYLAYFRNIYKITVEQIRESSDLVLSKEQSIDGAVDSICNWFENSLKS